MNRPGNTPGTAYKSVNCKLTPPISWGTVSCYQQLTRETSHIKHSCCALNPHFFSCKSLFFANLLFLFLCFFFCTLEKDQKIYSLWFMYSGPTKVLIQWHPMWSTTQMSRSGCFGQLPTPPPAPIDFSERTRPMQLCSLQRVLPPRSSTRPNQSR